MSVSGFEFADLVDEAVDRSGGNEATSADVVKIRRGLRLLTERWTAQGYNSWRVEQTTTSVAAGYPEVSLPRDLDDVLQVNVVRSKVETTLERISATRYAQITSKLTAGQPSQFYLDRKEKPKLFVFPVGTSAFNDVLHIWYVARPPQFDLYGDTTDDVPGRWLEALTLGLALDLAKKRPPYNEPLIQRLTAEYAQAEDLAQRADRDRGRYRYRTSYGR